MNQNNIRSNMKRIVQTMLVLTTTTSSFVSRSCYVAGFINHHHSFIGRSAAAAGIKETIRMMTPSSRSSSNSNEGMILGRHKSIHFPVRKSHSAAAVLSCLSSSGIEGNEGKYHHDITRRNLFEQTKIATLSIGMAIIILFGYPMVSFGAGVVVDPFIYNNAYDDPLHPFCKRRIEVAADGKTFHYSGTAVGPKNDPVLRGCSPAEIRQYKLRQGSFDGYILDNGSKISAGDGIHEGVWEPAGSVSVDIPYNDIDGIRWNDGNKWTVVKSKPLSTMIGEFIFYSYIGFSTLAGAKGLYDGIIRKKKEAEEQLV